MSQTTQIVESDVVSAGQHIQVSGQYRFPERRWREAVLHYLFGVWSNDDKVMDRPKINFDGITLRLDEHANTYYAYGQFQHWERRSNLKILLMGKRFRARRSGETLEVGCGRHAVEIALIRFVKDNQISKLVIDFRPIPAAFILQKTTRRGEYLVEGTGLPPMETAEEFFIPLGF